MDLIQPETVVTLSVAGGLSRSCLIVGARENLEAEVAVVEANRRKIMIDAREEQTRRCARSAFIQQHQIGPSHGRARPAGPIPPLRLCTRFPEFTTISLRLVPRFAIPTRE